MSKPSLPKALAGFAAFLVLGWGAGRAGMFAWFIVATGAIVLADTIVVIVRTPLDLTDSQGVRDINHKAVLAQEAEDAREAATQEVG
jgi:hypothetical protein